jgi:hypothetical protein
MVAAVVVRRRCGGGGSGRKAALEGAASARYCVARWNGHAGSVRLKLVDCGNFVCAMDLPGFSWASCLHPPLI